MENGLRAGEGGKATAAMWGGDRDFSARVGFAEMTGLYEVFGVMVVSRRYRLAFYLLKSDNVVLN